MVVCDGSLAIGAELHFVGSVPLPYHFASSANDEADTRVVYKIRERCHQFAELTFVFTIFTRMMFVQFAATIFLVPVAIQLVSAAPAIKTVQLHPFGQLGKCLDLQGNIRSGGQPIQVYDCNGSSAQNWEIADGPTVVKLAGTNYCLDSGDNVDGNRIEVKTCKEGKASQQWNYTEDKHIENQGQCVDTVKGNNQNGNRVQSWKCSRPSQHQVWSTARTST
ncbi:hypothetical protein CCMSSC00406_0009311 [Pleurotus cornucopiae]|uniref:Uncharacterized protein n=1 Tax=Pleurotus cornucopiae TaxID=5321 RepID=A0ACB7IWV6_PLECO|nr:hypothetical protein CCMSSC00406_0009311 [Pleurotus cornucopiae]